MKSYIYFEAVVFMFACILYNILGSKNDVPQFTSNSFIDQGQVLHHLAEVTSTNLGDLLL